MTAKLICIECPRGCEMAIETEKGVVSKITGNFCVKGKGYAEAEVTAPKRVLTTTVRLASGAMLPVKTDKAVDKDKLLDTMKKINLLTVEGPVSIGRILSKNIDGAGADLIATKNV